MLILKVFYLNDVCSVKKKIRDEKKNRGFEKNDSYYKEVNNLEGIYCLKSIFLEDLSSEMNLPVF